MALTLILLLVGRMTLARRPFEGWSPALALGFGALSGLGVWILMSALWSDAPARALSEFDRVLLYALVMALTGCAAVRRGDLGAILRWTAAAFSAIALAGLLTRLLPGTFPTGEAFLPERLSFPVTYWNAMGLACALAILLALHLTASGREPAWVRVAAAASVVPAGVALYLTFSRGAIWVLPLGVVLYVLLAQPRGLLTGLPAALVPAAIAFKVAYGAEALASADYTDSAAAAVQGRHVFAVVAACALGAAVLRAAAIPLDRRLEAIQVARMRPLRIGLVAGVLAVLVAGGLIADAPRRLEDARETFAQGGYLNSSPDLRNRLTSAVDNGRIDNWRVALDSFGARPLDGTGAGTFRLTWERERPAPPMKVNDGHSLYLETLSELGVPGLVMLLVALGAVLGAGVAGLRGPERHAYAALVAAGTMLALHAGVDWDWEMPVLFVWFFGAGGAALAARGGRRRLGELGRTPRIVASLAVLVLAITPALFALSQGPLDRAVSAFADRDCRTAIDAALDATERFGVRPEPWVILGYCDARAGQYALARRAMDAARSRDPRNWQIAYGQAIVYGVSGLDPRPFAAEALRLNPLDPLARSLVRDLARAKTAARRREVTRRAALPAE